MHIATRPARYVYASEKERTPFSLDFCGLGRAKALTVMRNSQEWNCSPRLALSEMYLDVNGARGQFAHQFPYPHFDQNDEMKNSPGNQISTKEFSVFCELGRKGARSKFTHNLVKFQFELLTNPAAGEKNIPVDRLRVMSKLCKRYKYVFREKIKF